MRLITFTHRADSSARQQIGALIDDDHSVVPLVGDPAFASMIDLMRGGDVPLDKAREVVAARRDRIDRSAVRVLAPVPVPESMRDFACFPDHLVNIVMAIHRRKAAKEADPAAAMERFRAAGLFELPADYYELPRFHSSNRHSVIGPEEDAIWPRFSRLMDFELEFGIFIGRQGKDIPETEARPYIFGYTIFNDFTARDMQMREGRPGGKGKEFDSGSVLGPCIVTADEIPDPYNLKMESRVNGQVWCSGSSATMARSFEQIIAHMSDSTTLYPGEFFGSGTHGNGSGMEIDRFLSPGDLIELTVEGIGTLSTRIVKPEGQA